MNNLLERIQMLFFVVLLPLLISETLCYPVFGTKRYGRSASTRSRRGGLEAYLQPPYYPEPIKYPPFATASEYDVEYYYPPEPAYNYPVTGPYGRRYPLTTNPSEKFAGGYQTLMPYVYAGRSPAVGYYGMPEPTLPVDDGEEQRGDALPIGQETWFEPQEALADANAAFLQNLILSQMYNDAQSGGEVPRLHNTENLVSPAVSDEADLDWVYDNAANAGYYADDYEDEDVKELKSLVKKTNKNGKNGNGNDLDYQMGSRRLQQEGNSWYEKKKNLDSNVWEAFGKRSNEYYGKVIENPMNRNQHTRWADLPNRLTESFERKAKRADDEENKHAGTEVADAAKTSAMPLTEAFTSTEFDSRRGQKEVPLLRPPTRHAVFAELAGDKLASGELASVSNPSVYETIKQLLSMEQGLKDETDESRPAAMKKRFVSNEETLVDQLGRLSKSST